MLDVFKANAGVVATSVVLTLAVLAPVAYKAKQAMPPAIGTVDLQALIEEEQKRTLDVLQKSGGSVSDEQRQALTALTQDFAKKLSKSVDRIGESCGCVLVNKAALLGGASTDYTDFVRKQLKGVE